MRPALTPLQLLSLTVAAVPRREGRVHPQGRRPARLRHGSSPTHCARVRKAPPPRRRGYAQLPLNRGGASWAAESPARGPSGIPRPGTAVPAHEPRLCGQGCSPAHPTPPPRGSRHPADIWGPFLHSRFPASLPFRQRKPLPHPAHSPLAPWELPLSPLLQSIHDPRPPGPIPINILDTRLSFAASK